MNTATVRADDQTLQNVIAVKSWLNAIIGGALTVTEAAAPPSKLPPDPAP